MMTTITPSSLRESLPYRPCVGLMLINQAGLVFTGRRIDTKVEAWQMPQGGIDDDEEPQVALYREAEEEIGTRKFSIIRPARQWLNYDLPDQLLGSVWNGRYRGQRQLWFAARFEGTDSDINIATDHAEFAEWQWAPMATLPDMIVPFKRSLYETLVAEFDDISAAL